MHRLLRAVLFVSVTVSSSMAAEESKLTMHWEDEILTIRGNHLPGKEMKIWYLEAYCRDNSQTTHWGQHTVVGHETELISRNEEGTRIRLQCTVSDGLIVNHVITSSHDEIDIRITAHNPTDKRSGGYRFDSCGIYHL